MLNKGFTLLIVSVFVCLVSGLSFAVSNEYQLDINDYFDIETRTDSTTLNASHDFKCVGTGTIQLVNDARAMVNATYGDIFTANLTSLLGYYWNQENKYLMTGVGQPARYVYIATNEWNYSRIQSETVTTSKCEFNIWDNVNTTPFFDGDGYPSNYQQVSWSIDDTYNDDEVYLSPVDLGVLRGNYVGSLIKFRGVDDTLSMYNGTESKFDHEFLTAENLETELLSIDCLSESDYVTDTSREAVTEPPDRYKVYCFNTSELFTGKSNAVISFAVINRTNVRNGFLTGIEIDFGMTWFNGNYFNIYDVSHSPTNPIENNPVSIRWLTTKVANSTIYWRSTELGNNLSSDDSYSGWSTKHDNATVLDRTMIINATSIIDGRFYQYYVESSQGGTTVNSTNSGIYYNFTVGFSSLPNDWVDPTYENDTVTWQPVVHDATKDLADALGSTQQEIVYLLFFLILMLCCGAVVIVTGNPVLAVAIFITGAILFSLFGFLPNWVFIIIALVFGFAMVKIIQGLMS